MPDDQPCPSHCQTQKQSNLSKSHRRYTRVINFREYWKGYLWQGRSCLLPNGKRCLLKAAAYVELTPSTAKAGMVKIAWDYRWNSVHANLSEKDKHGIIQSEEEAWN